MRAGHEDSDPVADGAPAGRADAPSTGAPPVEPLRLRLFVTGTGPNSLRARHNLEALLGACGVPLDVLDVVDCLVEPRRALADAVLVTPTLLRIAPGPRQVIVGCLTDADRVRATLGLDASAGGAARVP